MRAVLQKIAITAATAIAIAGSTVAIPTQAEARGGHWGGGHWGGHWGGGHWGHGHWGGGFWGWPRFGWGYAGYYGYGPYYADYGYGGECYIQRHWVTNHYGHRVLRRVYVCA